LKQNIIKEKSFKFAVRIVNLCKYLSESKKEFVLSKQMLRCGTATGALIREAEHAEYRADFNHKLAIARKEINETLYWFELMKETNIIENEHFESINSDAVEILKILTLIIKSSENKS